MFPTLIEKAIRIALDAHAGTAKRGRNLPYIVHPCEVMGNLSAAGVTNECVLAAAVLHDVMEDCPVSFHSRIIEDLGIVVFQYVELLTKTGADKSARHCQMFKGIRADKWAALIKMSDRLSNLSTIDRMTWSEDKKEDYLIEAWDIQDVARNTHFPDKLDEEYNTAFEILAERLENMILLQRNLLST